MVTPTDRQAEIRDWADLALLVIAPAGCGKTEAMALRVAELIGRGQVPWPTKVLVTTFSNRARDNISERLSSYLPRPVLRDRVVVCNLHGLSARIYQAHANVIGLDPAMKIPNSDWIGDQCRSRRLSYDRSRYVQDVLRTAKQRPFCDVEVMAELMEEGDEVACAIEKQRIAENRLTYDDLPRVAELILRNDAVADLYRCHFASIIVDEFQDLTPQQLRMIQRLGYQRTTYAGDLAQGIYGFAGAAPAEIFREVQGETSKTIVFAESHRSAPAVLEMVNALAPFTSGHRLRSADPGRWPSGGLAAMAVFPTAVGEAAWAVNAARHILDRAPAHRVAVIARTSPRRRFADIAFSQSGLPHCRWNDPIMDTDTARILKPALAELGRSKSTQELDVFEVLSGMTGIATTQDPSTRQSLSEAVQWASDLLDQGLSPGEINSRITIGDQATLLTAPGVHLLTGHLGKGQQFDWVIIVGTEDGCIPDFRASTQAELAEEARVLSVMISRARHGAVLLRASSVEDRNGNPRSKRPSRFLEVFDGITNRSNEAEIWRWLQQANWDQLSKAI
jgi:DNA helicase II / ATP-dependent DNA helicase PcrA